MKKIKGNTNSRYVVESVFTTSSTGSRKSKLEELLIKVIKASENKNP